jgi:hypothetical protein
VNYRKADKKITPSDLRAQAQQLIGSGRMPSLDNLLNAVAETRRKYVPKLWLHGNWNQTNDGPETI